MIENKHVAAADSCPFPLCNRGKICLIWRLKCDHRSSSLWLWIGIFTRLWDWTTHGFGACWCCRLNVWCFHFANLWGNPWVNSFLQRMRFVCLLLLVVVSALAEKKPVTKLQIGVKKRIPAEDCPIKTRNGDNLHMVNTQINEKPFRNQDARNNGLFQHYTGTLYEDGSEFDSSIPRYLQAAFSLWYPTLHHWWWK